MLGRRKRPVHLGAHPLPSQKQVAWLAFGRVVGCSTNHTVYSAAGNKVPEKGGMVAALLPVPGRSSVYVIGDESFAVVSIGSSGPKVWMGEKRMHARAEHLLTCGPDTKLRSLTHIQPRLSPSPPLHSKDQYALSRCRRLGGLWLSTGHTDRGRYDPLFGKAAHRATANLAATHPISRCARSQAVAGGGSALLLGCHWSGEVCLL